MGALLTVRKLADRSTGERLRVPITQPVELADGTVVQVETGQVKLVNPATPGDAHESWPLAGIQVVDAPDECTVGARWVTRGVAEGWIELEGARLVTRPAGPAHDPTASTHQFVHADALVIHSVDGDVRYRVTHQPDKYADHEEADDETPVTSEAYAAGGTRVDHFYGLEREA